MIMRLYECDVEPSGGGAVEAAEAWVPDGMDPDGAVGAIRELAGRFGYVLADGGEVCGTDERQDLDPAYEDDLFGVVG